MIHYREFKLSMFETILALCAACGVLFVIGYIFFKSVLFALLISLFGIVYPRIRRDALRQKRLSELNLQFKQVLYILASALAAGKSVESAFHEANEDLTHLFPDEKTFIRVEFKAMSARLDYGESIEMILRDFSERTGLQDIHNFAEVFVICKRSGGNLVEVMRNTANMISEKIAMQQEISVMIAQKRFESRILTMTPFIFVAILSTTSADYMAPLYEGKGRIVMGSALIVLLCCYIVSKKIMDIKV